MLKKVALGIDNFKEIIEENIYFVDKTLFIKDFMEDGSKILVLPRPRRFGKTLNMSMLRYFLDNKESSKELFEGLEISKNTEFCNKHMNKYPLIYIGLKEVKKNAWKDSFKLLKEMVQKEYKRHSDIIKSLDRNEKAYYEKVMNSPEESDLDTSLLELCKFLEKHYGKKAIVLIDEYDAPIHKSYIKEYYEDAMNFFQTFFGSVMKSNDHLHKGLMTGILRVSKESMFSGLNNVKVVSILSEQYSQYFGFTEEESVTFANTYDIDTEGMKDWYNGYRIGNYKIYNPWSVINYIDNKGELRAYWVNTSSNDLIRKLIKKGTNTTKENLITLSEGKSILIEVNKSISLKDIELEEEQNFLSLLLYAGYLTWEDKVRDGDETKYSLVVPNKEVKGLLKGFLKEVSKSVNELNEMLKNIREENWDKFKEEFERSVLVYFSYFDVNGVAENFYHAFVMGMLVNLEKEYEIRSNREAGLGRYDVVIVKRDRSMGVIFEFKRALFKEELEEMAIKAVKQIEERGYEREFEGVRMKKIGIGFKGKEALVLFGN